MKTTTINRLAAIALAAVALAGCQTWKDIERPDDSDVRYVIPKDLAPEDNAYLAFIAATNAVVDWTAAEYGVEASDESVLTNEAAFALYHEAAQKPYWIQPRSWGVNPSNPEEITYLFPAEGWCLTHLFPAEGWCRFHNLLQRRIFILLSRGEIDAAIDCIADVFALSRTASFGNVSVFGNHDALLVCGRVCRQAEIVASSGRATDKQLARLVRVLDGVPSARASLPSAIRSEYDAFVCVEAKRMGSHGERRNWWGKPLYQPNKTRRVYLDFLRRAINLAEKKDYDKNAWEAWENDALRDIDPRGGEPACDWNANEDGRALVREVLPLYCGSAVAWAASQDAVCQSARIAVANELFRRRNGRYVENLDELVPEYLKDVPASSTLDKDRLDR